MLMRFLCALLFLTLTLSSHAANRALNVPKGSDLTKVQAQVRQWLADEATGDVEVLLEEGVYEIPEGLSFGKEDGGNDTRRVSWKGVRRGRVILQGSINLKQHKKNPEGSCTAFFPPLSERSLPKILIENGVRLRVARHPNHAYLFTGMPCPWDRSSFFFSPPPSLPSMGWDGEPCSIFYWHQTYWTNENPVRAYHPSARQISFSGNPFKPVAKGTRFIFRQHPKFVDEPGEFSINPTTRTVKWIPHFKEISSLRVTTAPHLLSIRANNLHFENLVLRESSGPGIVFQNANSCSIQHCRIETTWGDGIILKAPATLCEISRNLIGKTGRHGVYLEGPPPGKPNTLHHHTISSNRIHNCGLEAGDGSGVMVQMSSDNTITNNLIHHCSRYGISLKGYNLTSLSKVLGRNTTPQERIKRVHTHGNTIALNQVSHVNTSGDDSGAIEMWGTVKPNVIDSNIVSHSGTGRQAFQSTLYIDDACDGTLIRNNILMPCKALKLSPIIHIKGCDNIIENNLIITSKGTTAAIYSQSYGEGEEASRNLTIRGNTLVLNSPETFLYQFPNFSKERLKETRQNLLYTPEGKEPEIASPGPVPYDTWIRQDPRHREVGSFITPLKERPKTRLPILKHIGLPENFPKEWKTDIPVSSHLKEVLCGEN